jgi:large subunit ribosomal protein L9
MKVIFTENVKSVASKGDVKNVKNGYARNFLLPRRKAIVANEQALNEWEGRRNKLMIEKEQFVAKLEEIKRRVSETKIKIEKKSTAKGTLYGGVKAADIVKAVKENLNIEVPETAVIFEKPIKAAGMHTVKLHFGEGVEASIEVEVTHK